MNNSMSPLDALRTALKSEEEAYKFYIDAAKNIDQASAKKMFEFLAGEELKHQELIQDEIDKGFYREM